MKLQAASCKVNCLRMRQSSTGPSIERIMNYFGYKLIAHAYCAALTLEMTESGTSLTPTSSKISFLRVMYSVFVSCKLNEQGKDNVEARHKPGGRAHC
jgi:hypothetical protein